jgi:outer membrane biosynthesis protein TonB
VRPGRALLAALLTPVALLAAEPPVHHPEQEEWGRLERVVRPDYPWLAVQRRQSGKVEIRGRVRPDSFLDDIQLIPDSPASSIFVDALQEPVKGWRFIPAHDNDCQPVPAPVRAEVSFEIDDGTPRIFVTHKPAEKARPAKPAPEYYKPLKRIAPAYPVEPLRRNIIADVYARVVVDRSGKVTDVKSRAYSRRDVGERALEPFTREADATLSRWEFPPVPEGAQAPWVGCFRVYFTTTR